MAPTKKTDPEPEEDVVEEDVAAEEPESEEPVETPLERELRMAKAAGKPKERIAAIEAAIKADK